MVAPVVRLLRHCDDWIQFGKELLILPSSRLYQSVDVVMTATQDLRWLKDARRKRY
jgi:hypothetical protein